MTKFQTDIMPNISNYGPFIIQINDQLDAQLFHSTLRLLQ